MNHELDIAIVGMSCRFPGAGSIDEFWRNLYEGIESIFRLSDEEMLKSGVPASYLNSPSYVKAAPILEAPGNFDARFFGLSPVEAKTMDPQHRIMLELAYEALDHAGYDPDRYQGRVGVFAAAAFNTYFMNSGLNGRFTEEYIPTLIGNDKDFLATRISYKLNLKGPSITIQTACSSSMVATHLARQSLLSEEIDMALAGAISVRVPQKAGYFYDRDGVVSSDGHVRAFDAKANGTVFGSGGGILVLKRLADALSDGDTIHAVIRGSAVNNDGSEKAGYSAPSVNSQSDAVVEALANAGVDAESISYIEAHGSGTPVGDPIEIRALTKAFRTFTRRSQYCAIGSVKTNVGHLDAAAAVAGIIKTVLALKHRQIPPSLHFNEANPEIDFPNTPFFVNTHLREWASGGPRRAGVMSTGMGGTNAYIVLEEAPEPAVATDSAPPHLLILSAKTETALNQATIQLRGFLNRNDSVNMSDVAYTLRAGRKAFPYRRSVVCASHHDAVNALNQPNSTRVLPAVLDRSSSSIVLLLPGIGDHYVGMARDLYETRAVFRQEVDRCAEILQSHMGQDIRRFLYPNNGANGKQGSTPKGIDLKKMLGHTSEPEDQDTRNLNQTEFAQPALFTIEYAMTRFWQSLGVNPDVIIGHSMGEYVAACVAGVLSLDDALRLLAIRARLVSGLPAGAMLAVVFPEKELLPVLPQELSISLINGPELCVVAGPVAAMADFEGTLNERGILFRHVRNNHAFHSTMLDPIEKPFEKEVSKVRLSAPSIPYISNVTGTWITAKQATDPAYWSMHATRTARFSDALHQLWQLDNPILLESGPGRTLITLALQHPAKKRETKAVAISSLRHHYENGSDVEFLWNSVGTLWQSGVSIKWDNLYPGQQGRRIPLPTYPFERQHYWLEPALIPEASPRLQGSTRKRPNPSEWFYVPSWKRLLPKGTGVHEELLHAAKGRKWLFFADDCGFASELIQRLKSTGHDIVTVTAGSSFQQADIRSFMIDPSNVQDYERLIHALQVSATLPDHIVHAWSVTAQNPAESSADGFTRAQELGFYSLLFLGKALATHNVVHEIQLFALSSNIQDVCGAEVLSPEKSTLLGPCIVLRQEYPNIRTRSIDVDLPAHAIDYHSTVEVLLGEFVDSDPGVFVAYRNAQRWVQTYEPVTLDHPVSSGSSFRKGGTYLITGGLGKVGIAISEYLAENYRAKLVLVGRTSLSTKEVSKAGLKGHATHAIQAKLRALERIEQLGGEVLYVAANVADRNDMRRVIERAHARFGVIQGVIHGAGIVKDGFFVEIAEGSFAKCDPQFQPKAQSLLVLKELLAGEPLDFFLLMSSLASVLGGLGEATYASANIYMDTFARKHSRSSSVPWLSVNWDFWRGADTAAIHSGLGATIKDLGMSSAEATSVLETVLAVKNASQLVVSTGDLGARINQWIKLDSQHNRDPSPVAKPSQPTVSQADADGRVLAPPNGYSRQTGELEAFDNPTEAKLARLWEDVLGIESIGPTQNFFELGGHSLLLIRLLVKIENCFHRRLRIANVFEAPTVRTLAAVICAGEAPPEIGELIPIQHLGTRDPFFVVGGGPVFRPLAEHLGLDQPVFSLLPQADVSKLTTPYQLSELADQIVGKLVLHSHRGLYYIGGWCLGGVLAFEVARQLIARGREVGLLVLFDSPTPTFFAISYGKERWRYLYHLTLRHLSKLAKMRSKDWLAYTYEGLQGAWGKVRNLKPETRSPLDGQDRVLLNAAINYRAEPVPVPTVLFLSKERAKGHYWDIQFDWKKFISGTLDVHEVPGDHRSMFTDPHVRILAAELGKYLGEDLRSSGFANARSYEARVSR
jgi:acyl transferase domain-containing protein/thioesterase domain-containing protein